MFEGIVEHPQDLSKLDADQVQPALQQLHELLRMEMKWSQDIMDEGPNTGQLPAPNSQVGTKVRLNARHIRTMIPSRKLAWTQLGPYWVAKRVSQYAFELE